MKFCNFSSFWPRIDRYLYFPHYLDWILICILNGILLNILTSSLLTALAAGSTKVRSWLRTVRYSYWCLVCSACLGRSSLKFNCSLFGGPCSQWQLLTGRSLMIILGILSTSNLNSGLGINMDGQDPNSSYIEQSNCDATMSSGDTICGSRMMACRETGRNGEIECSSFCSGKLSKMRHSYES